MVLAPIVLFVYNRFWHTKKTVEALLNNKFASESELIVYSDAAKSNDSEAREEVNYVRNYIRNVKGFKSITLIERESNWGLSANIIDGVTTVVNSHGRVIVLEDDIVTSPAFLAFMNNALSFYEKQNKIWHISGWNYPITVNGLDDAFFLRVMNCWGWATWVNRWENYSKDPFELLNNWSKTDIKNFDINNSGGFWRQVEANANGQLNTWAVFWYSTIFKNDGLCLNPTVSYVNNIGHDGSGVNCNSTENYNIVKLNEKTDINFPMELSESALAISRVEKFYASLKKPLIFRILRKLRRIVNFQVNKS